ncbi:hypothetical protein ASE00_14040 [Sphingomonas sp. Root710]|nr:hypothetical protein ASE00_14040 [Sphingomonas sp. Root710]
MGKILILGGAALSALYAHGVLACQLHPKARSVAEAQARKSVRIAEVERRAPRVNPSYAPIFSRRLILQ